MKKIYLQSKNRDMDLGNKGVDTEGEGGDGMLWEVGTDIHALLILGIKQVTNEHLLQSTGSRLSALWGPEQEGNPKKGGIGRHAAETLC